MSIVLNSNQGVRMTIIIIIKSKCLLNSRIPSIIELAGSCNLNCQKSGASQIKKKEDEKVIFSFKKLKKLVNEVNKLFSILFLTNYFYRLPF